MAKTLINKAILWIRKVLEVTEKTSMPTSIEDELRATIDAFGWEQLNEQQQETTSATNSNVVSGTVVPADVMRLVLEASVEYLDSGAQNTIWIEHLHQASNLATGVQSPFIVPLVAVAVKLPLMRWILMQPGDSLRGRSAPATAVGIDLTLISSFVDIPIGEYVRGF